jgi:hypothetical protein
VQRSVDKEGEDLLAFIEEGAHRTGKSVDIPSPEGRVAAGWVAVQGLKIQPEVFTMMEQLREHKLFNGKWKTSAQVAWSMIYLGLQACHDFYSKSEGFEEFKSNFRIWKASLAEKEAERQQELLNVSARNFRALVHRNLSKGTAFGRYKAWRILETMMKMRDSAEDVLMYDQQMRSPSGPVLDSNLVFDNRAGEYWTKLYPTVGGPLDEDAADLIYTSLTTEHFAELEAANAPAHED